jgi:multiple sugar transport system permease protein
MNNENTSKKILAHGILLVFAVICIFPFYWMIITALKSPTDVMEFPPKIYPKSFEVSNFVRVFELMPMGFAYLNSIKITFLTTFGTLLTSSLAAFAFAKMKFKFKGLLFAILLGTMMIPTQVTLIPLYIVFGKMGWVDTHLPLIIPTVLTNAYGVFMIRQFMLTLPNEYIESAQIDGYGYFRIFIKIILPLSKPIIVTLGLFTFIWSWNDYLKPLIFLNTDTKFTVPLIISSFRGVYEVQWELLMAASTVAVLPIIILYLFSQKYFVEGIAMTGIKG